MPHEFSRTELLIGHEGIERLFRSKVLIFGVGGVGSHCIEALARSGVGSFVLVDNDVVSITNINRQSIAYHSTVGQYKTKVMEARIHDINPAAKVLTHETFVLSDNLDAIITPDIHYIIDAIDTVTAKLAIAEAALRLNIPLISSMGTGNKLNPFLFRIADIYDTSVCPLCKVMRKELKKRNIPALTVLFSEEKPQTPVQGLSHEPEVSAQNRPLPGSIAFVPPVAGLMIAGKVICELAGVVDC